MSLAWRDQKPQGTAKRVGVHVDLGGQSTPGAPQSLILSPFSGCCLLVSTNDGTVGHLVSGQSANTRSRTPAWQHRLKR